MNPKVAEVLDWLEWFPHLLYVRREKWLVDPVKISEQITIAPLRAGIVSVCAAYEGRDEGCVT